MKRGFVGTLWLCGLAFALIGCRSKTEEKGGKPASVVHEARGSAQKSGAAEDLLDVFFISPATLPPGAEPIAPNAPPAERKVRFGFAVGKANTILRTADAGATWSRVLERKDSGPEFFSVLFSNPMEGWAVSGGVLLHTTDVGETWAPASKLPGMFYYFGPHAATASSYFQMQPPTCSATVWKAQGGGKTWTALKPALPRNDYETVFFFDDLHGWVAGNYGHFAFTEDGGQTWREQDVPEGGHLTQIQFISPQLGWMRRCYAEEGAILTTADGGKTWQRQNAGLESCWEVRDMQFLDAKTGFLLVSVGDGKTHVLRTPDGGTTWQTIGVHHVPLMAMSFVSANEGWVVGTGGCIFHYHE